MLTTGYLFDETCGMTTSWILVGIALGIQFHELFQSVEVPPVQVIAEVYNESIRTVLIVFELPERSVQIGLTILLYAEMLVLFLKY